MNKFIFVLSFCLLPSILLAKDDGRYTNSPLKDWFDHLVNGKGGLCCSLADGVTIQDPDWKTVNDHYEVRLNGKWLVVPDDALIKEPNRIGQTMVWPFAGEIRCFMPGSLT